jgi:ADP-heptose:LPS heptosyltransferase
MRVSFGPTDHIAAARTVKRNADVTEDGCMLRSLWNFVLRRPRTILAAASRPERMIPQPSLAHWLRLRLQRIWLHWDRYPQDGTTLRPFCGIVEVRGWAVAADGIRSVSVYCGEKLVGTAALGLRRRDLFRLFPHIRMSRRAGFQCLLDTKKIPNGYHRLTLVARSAKEREARLSSTVFIKNLSTSYDRYRQQTAANAAALAWMRRNVVHLPYQPRVSLAIVLDDARHIAHLETTIRSLASQAYADWQLLIACDHQLRDQVTAQVRQVAPRDGRIQLIVGDLADARQACLSAATGELFGFLDPGDLLSADALFELVYHLNRHPDDVVVYSDEDTLHSFDTPAVPFLKPDWPSQLLNRAGHLGRLCVARKTALEAMGGFQGGSEDDPFFALAQLTQKVGHIRKVLCTRRRPSAADRAALDAGQHGFTGNEQPVVLAHAPCPLIDLEAIHSILVVKLDHLGDVLLTVPAMRRLREILPDARITALVGSWARPLMEAERCIDEVLTYDFFEASSSKSSRKLTDDDLRAIESLFTGRRFDLGIDLRRESDTRQFLRLSGATHTLGYANRNDCDWLTLSIPWDDVIPVQPPRRHVALDALRLIEMLPLSSRADVVTDFRLRCKHDPAVDSLLAECLPAKNGLLVGLHPGAGRTIKCWPAERFARLADRLIEQLGATVILFGTRYDEAEVEGVLKHVRHRDQMVSLAYQLTFPQFMAALPRLDFFVGNDSGPTHMAAAAGIPALGVYAATIDASQWAPLGPQAAVIQRRMMCSPCYLAKRQDCPYSVACLNDLSVEEVWEAAVRVLLPKWAKAGIGGQWTVVNKRPRDLDPSHGAHASQTP